MKFEDDELQIIHEDMRKIIGSGVKENRTPQQAAIIIHDPKAPRLEAIKTSIEQYRGEIIMKFHNSC